MRTTYYVDGTAVSRFTRKEKIAMWVAAIGILGVFGIVSIEEGWRIDGLKRVAELELQLQTPEETAESLARYEEYVRHQTPEMQKRLLAK